MEHEAKNDDDDDDTDSYVDDDSIEWRLGQSKLAGSVLWEAAELRIIMFLTVISQVQMMKTNGTIWQMIE